MHVRRLLFSAADGGLLALPELGIGTTSMGEQRRMTAALNDHAVIQHNDFIRIDHGRKPMGDHQGRAISRHLVKRGLDFPFGMGVER